MPPGALLEIRDLRVSFATGDGLVKAVDGVSLRLESGRSLGIVGESGSGKTVTSLAVMGLHRGSSTQITGEIWLDGEELTGADPDRVRSLRGSKMAMIFQDPQSALHPYYTVGRQIAEAYRVHNRVSKQAARRHAADLLGRVGIPRPAVRINDYPHQFSGGMRQRVMIATALCCGPRLLIADEPTTALDVTVQAQILDLIAELRQEYGSAVIVISHDLGVVAELADDVLVMYAGRVVERAAVAGIFFRPAHPYTWGLLGSMPRIEDRARRLVPIAGTPPSLITVPAGCAFHPRCPHAGTDGQACRTAVPTLREIGPEHAVACHLSAAQRQRALAGHADQRGECGPASRAGAGT